MRKIGLCLLFMVLAYCVTTTSKANGKRLIVEWVMYDATYDTILIAENGDYVLWGAAWAQGNPPTSLNIDTTKSFWTTDPNDNTQWLITVWMVSKSDCPFSTLTCKTWNPVSRQMEYMERANGSTVRMPYIEGGLDIEIVTTWYYRIPKTAKITLVEVDAQNLNPTTGHNHTMASVEIPYIP